LDGEQVEHPSVHGEEPALCTIIEEQKRLVDLLDRVRKVPDEIKQLREQVETLSTQLPQQIVDAIKSQALAEKPRLTELVEQRAAQVEREQRLSENHKKLEALKRQVVSKGKETLREVAEAEQQQEQRGKDLDQKERLLDQREEQIEFSNQETEREHCRREQCLQEERQKLHILKIEVEIREAHSRDQASKLIRLCQRVARLGGSSEGVDASLHLLALAKDIVGRVEQPSRITASASKNASAERLLHTPPSGDGSESSAPFPVGSGPSSSLNNRS